MAKRLLRDWTDSESMDALSMEAEVFFTRLIMKADDYGSYHANPKLLKAALFPLKEMVTFKDIGRWMCECIEADLIFLYEAEGKELIRIKKFDQRLRNKRNVFPHPGMSGEVKELHEMGYVYLIGEDYNHPVKVGYSLNPWARLKEISIGSPIELSVLLTFKAEKIVESSIHKLLKAYRTKNEWFNIPKDVVDTLIEFSKSNDGDILESLRSTPSLLRSTPEREVEEKKEVEVEVESEVTRAEFVDANVPRGLKIELPDKNQIFEEIFSDDLFVEGLRRGHPKKDIQRAWEECWLYHSQTPSPPTLGWQWRQKLSTWLINTKDEYSKKGKSADTANARREAFARKHGTGTGG